MNSNSSNSLDLRNVQEQVKKTFCYQKLFWLFTVWTNCSSDLKIFANSQPSASDFIFFPWSLEQFFLTVAQNNFCNKIAWLHFSDLLEWVISLYFTNIFYFSFWHTYFVDDWQFANQILMHLVKHIFIPDKFQSL